MQVAFSNAKEAEIIATVIKADGTVIEYGVVSYWHKNPIKRLIWNIKKLFRRT
jgi:hypothetical protein